MGLHVTNYHQLVAINHSVLCLNGRGLSLQYLDKQLTESLVVEQFCCLATVMNACCRALASTVMSVLTVAVFNKLTGVWLMLLSLACKMVR